MFIVLQVGTHSADRLAGATLCGGPYVAGAPMVVTCHVHSPAVKKVIGTIVLL